jgi:hypothetical protein
MVELSPEVKGARYSLKQGSTGTNPHPLRHLHRVGSYNHFFVPPPIENVLAGSAGLTQFVSEIASPVTIV